MAKITKLEDSPTDAIGEGGEKRAIVDTVFGLLTKCGDSEQLTALRAGSAVKVAGLALLVAGVLCLLCFCVLCRRRRRPANAQTRGKKRT